MTGPDYWDDMFISAWGVIADRVHATARRKGFWDKARNDGEMIALMHSELSECLEGLRKGPDIADEHCPDYTSAEIEMADCIIRIMDMAISKQWVIPNAILAKMKYNEIRPYRHGKNF